MTYYSLTVKVIPTLKRYKFIEIFLVSSNFSMLLGPLMYKLTNLMSDAPRDQRLQLNTVFRPTMIFLSLPFDLYLEALSVSFSFIYAML
jgi:hypothetical protein